MKQCKHCSTEFQPKHETRGHEQIYCSVKCRYESYKQRANEKRNTPSDLRGGYPGYSGNISGGTTSERPSANLERVHDNSHTYGSLLSVGLLETIEGKFAAKTEAIEFKLRCEQLEKENENLRGQLSKLELQKVDDDDDDDEDHGALGSVLGLMDKYPEASRVIIESPFLQNIITQFIPKTQSNA